MAAVLGLDVKKVKEICLNSGAEVANLNCPGQIVITGKKEAVEKASDLCAQAGAKRVIPLEVSGGFHSSLMLEASVGLRKALENTPMVEPSVPVISNYTALPEDKVALIIDNLVQQIRSSVRWEDSIRYMLSQGVNKFYEFGPGKVLKGLIRKIDPNIEVISIEKKSDLEVVA